LDGGNISDFSDLETVGCDSHHIKTDPAGNRVALRGAGKYQKQNLVERYGADIRLPDLREEIAQCRRRGMHDACFVRYVDLVSRR